MSQNQSELRWPTSAGLLRAYEPSAAQVEDHAAALAAAYNEPYNRSMMGHAEMSERDVREHFAAMGEAGARLFLLEHDGQLAGDADFRHLDSARAEFAIMIGGRQSQGKGLGTRFAILLHAFAFRTLRLERVFITVLEENRASLRLFEKLGYQLDRSAEVRAHVDRESDIGMSIDRERFEQLHAAALREVDLPR